MTNLEIAQRATLKPIAEIAQTRLGIAPQFIESYGTYKAKLSLDHVRSLDTNPDGKQVLVTAISPTPAGEGKTTATIGLGDALKTGHIVNVREVRLAAGAEFIVMICGDVMTMPGLPRVPAAVSIDIDESGKVIGLF